jgi:hypothetical protein
MRHLFGASKMRRFFACPPFFLGGEHRFMKIFPYNEQRSELSFMRAKKSFPKNLRESLFTQLLIVKFVSKYF